MSDIATFNAMFKHW